MKNKYTAILIVFFLFNLTAQAQYQLVNINQNNTISFPLLNDEEKSLNNIELSSLLARRFEINSILSSVSLIVGDTLVLDLFLNKRYKAVIDKISTDINNVKTIRARIENYESATCFINASPENFFFNINIPELQEKYFIKKQIGSYDYFLIQDDVNQLNILEGLLR